MRKNITLNAEEADIEAARLRASAERKTLNQVFRDWIHRYARPEGSVQAFRRLISELGYASSGRKFSREEMNAR
jgi:hypothetical protein